MAEKPAFVPPSKQLNTLRKNLDANDQKQDDKSYETKLEADNLDLQAQLKHMVEEKGESAGAVFKAIEDSARELGIPKMDLLKLIGVPALASLIEHSPVSNLVYRQPGSEKPMTDDEQFAIYKDIYVYGKRYGTDANGKIVKKK